MNSCPEGGAEMNSRAQGGAEMIKTLPDHTTTGET